LNGNRRGEGVEREGGEDESSGPPGGNSLTQKSHVDAIPETEEGRGCQNIKKKEKNETRGERKRKADLSTGGFGLIRPCRTTGKKRSRRRREAEKRAGWERSGRVQKGAHSGLKGKERQEFWQGVY